VFAAVVLHGCRREASIAQGPKATTPRAAIEACLSSIREDLVRLKPRFPQLAAIEATRLEIVPEEARFRLDYDQGFVRDDRIRGPTFEKHGCDLMVEIRYPAAAGDANRRPIIGRDLLTGDGMHAAAWTLVRAERTEEAQRFVKEVEAVIARRLNLLAEELLPSM
jgi:hypothetical protein